MACACLVSKPRDSALEGRKHRQGIGSHVTLPGTARSSVANGSWGFLDVAKESMQQIGSKGKGTAICY